MPKTMPAFDVMTDEELNTYLTIPCKGEKTITAHNAAIDEKWVRFGVACDNEDRALVKVGNTTYRLVHDRAPHNPDLHRLTAVGPRGGVYRNHVPEEVVTGGKTFPLFAITANGSTDRPLKVQRAIVDFHHTEDGWVLTY